MTMQLFRADAPAGEDRGGVILYHPYPGETIRANDPNGIDFYDGFVAPIIWCPVILALPSGMDTMQTTVGGNGELVSRCSVGMYCECPDCQPCADRVAMEAESAAESAEPCRYDDESGNHGPEVPEYGMCRFCHERETADARMYANDQRRKEGREPIA